MQAPHRSAGGSVVTFYSYKGGTGRTMALANSACLLAEREGSAPGAVLVVDWDLEAPGLHRFFPPRLRTLDASLDLGLDDQPGLIDLFVALSAALPATEPADETDAQRAAAHALDAVPLQHYIAPTEVAGVSILRAGRNDDQQYSRRVNTFGWENLFRRAPGIYRMLAERLAQQFRWVLIDSRTGVTDISGICTSLMPEKLVVVFTPNRQSLTGVHDLVMRAAAYRLGSDDLRPLLVYPLPSRIEASLERLSRQWRHGHPDAGIVGYQPMFQQLLAESYGLERCDLQNYFDAVYIQQTPDCAYGEVISVREGGADRLSLASSYRVFVERLVSGRAPWEDEAAAMTASVLDAAAPSPPPVASDPFAERSRAASAPAGGAATPSAGAELLGPGSRPSAAPAAAAPQDEAGLPSTRAQGARVFVSWAAADRERVAAVIAALEARGHRVSWDRSIAAGSSYNTVVTQALDASDVVVVFWSRASIESKHVEAEVVEGMRRGVLVPVLLDEVLPPLAFRNIQAVDLSRGDSREAARLIDAVEHIAARRPGDTLGPVAQPLPLDPPAVPAATVHRPSTDAPSSAPVPRPRSKAAWVLVAAVAAGLAATLWALLPAREGADDAQRVSVPAPMPSPVAAPAQPRMVTVPQLVNLDSATAEAAAQSVGLAVSMVDADTGSTQRFLDGIVVEQWPAAKSEAPAGSELRLTVATKTVQVPAVNNSSLNDALSRLRAYGLELGKVDPIVGTQVKPGTVLEQNPRAGTRVPAGTRVNVGVAAAPTPQTTPSRKANPPPAAN